MSDLPIAVQILDEVRSLRAEVAELRGMLPARILRDATPPEDRVRRALILSRWYERVQSRPMPTRDVVALELEGAPAGTLQLVALELNTWTDEPHRVLGSSECYRLRRLNRHGLAFWRVERLS